MRITTLLAFILAFSAVAVTASPSWACKCTQANEELSRNAYNEADIVIRGKVINPSKGFTQSGPLLGVEVMEVIKGRDVPEFLNINYNNVTAACGSHFEAGDEVIMGIYDTRDLSRDTMARGYGFRLMSSCQQYYIRHYVEQMMNKENK